MKNQIATVVCFIAVNLLFAQTIQLTEHLVLQQLTAHCYVHTQNNNNGLVYIKNGEALIVSTPDSDLETLNLINWVRGTQQAKIVAYIIDRWHPDAMGGLDVVQKNGIKTYANESTRQIARERGLPVPETGFDTKMELEVGGEEVVCHFLGEAHTTDGIVVWIESEQTLFGGNEIRNYNGWVGNISDANLDTWSETATNVKNAYGSAKFVVPGHGHVGGAELIDYTIVLFDLPHPVAPTKELKKTLSPAFKTSQEVCIKAESDSVDQGRSMLKNAIVVVQDASKYVEIAAPLIIYHAENKRFESERGRVKIYDKTGSHEVLRTDVDYNRLIVYPYDNTVGFVVIMRAIESTHLPNR